MLWSEWSSVAVPKSCCITATASFGSWIVRVKRPVATRQGLTVQKSRPATVLRPRTAWAALPARLRCPSNTPGLSIPT